MSEAKPAELACIVRVAPEVLAQILDLPEGAYIDAVQVDAEWPGILKLRMRGIGAPVMPGQMLQTVYPIITRTRAEDGRELRQRVQWPTGSAPA